MKKKIKTKSKISKKKEIVPEDGRLFKIEEGKCIIIRPMWWIGSQDSLDTTLGFIVALFYNDISQIKDTYIRPSTWANENDKHAKELVYEFDIKDIKKIKKIEKAYFEKKVMVNVLATCDALRRFQDKLKEKKPKHLVSKHKKQKNKSK